MAAKAVVCVSYLFALLMINIGACSAYRATPKGPSETTPGGPGWLANKEDSGMTEKTGSDMNQNVHDGADNGRQGVNGSAPGASINGVGIGFGGGGGVGIGSGGIGIGGGAGGGIGLGGGSRGGFSGESPGPVPNPPSQPSPPFGTYQPSPPSGTYQPSPPSGTYQPSPPSGTCQPSPPSGTCQPSPPSGSYQPSPPSGSYQPSPPSGTCQPSPPSGSYQPSPPSGTYQPSPAGDPGIGMGSIPGIGIGGGKGGGIGIGSLCFLQSNKAIPGQLTGIPYPLNCADGDCGTSTMCFGSTSISDEHKMNKNGIHYTATVMSGYPDRVHDHMTMTIIMEGNKNAKNAGEPDSKQSQTMMSKMDHGLD